MNYLSDGWVFQEEFPQVHAWEFEMEKHAVKMSFPTPATAANLQSAASCPTAKHSLPCVIHKLLTRCLIESRSQGFVLWGWTHPVLRKMLFFFSFPSVFFFFLLGCTHTFHFFRRKAFCWEHEVSWCERRSRVRWMEWPQEPKEKKTHSLDVFSVPSQITADSLLSTTQSTAAARTPPLWAVKRRGGHRRRAGTPGEALDQRLTRRWAQESHTIQNPLTSLHFFGSSKPVKVHGRSIKLDWWLT